MPLQSLREADKHLWELQEQRLSILARVSERGNECKWFCGFGPGFHTTVSIGRSCLNALFWYLSLKATQSNANSRQESPADCTENICGYILALRIAVLLWFRVLSNNQHCRACRKRVALRQGCIHNQESMFIQAGSYLDLMPLRHICPRPLLLASEINLSEMQNVSKAQVNHSPLQSLSVYYNAFSPPGGICTLYEAQ